MKADTSWLLQCSVVQADEAGSNFPEFHIKIQNEISKNKNGKWKAKENNKSGMKRERERDRQAGRD